jgi:hypothetical protein
MLATGVKSRPPPSQLILGGFQPYVGCAVVIITDVYLPRSTTHLTVLDVGLDGPAGRIDAYGHLLPTVRAAHLDLGVPGSQLGGLERRFRIFRALFVNRITQVTSSFVGYHASARTTAKP